MAALVFYHFFEIWRSLLQRTVMLLGPRKPPALRAQVDEPVQKEGVITAMFCHGGANPLAEHFIVDVQETAFYLWSTTCAASH